MASSTLPHMDERKLIQALKEQGFEVIPTKSGFVVRKDDQSTSFHPSMLEKNGHAGQAVWSSLKSIGFKSPDVWNREQKAERKSETKWYPWCTVQGCARSKEAGSPPFAQPMHKARHEQAIHGAPKAADVRVGVDLNDAQAEAEPRKAELKTVEAEPRMAKSGRPSAGPVKTRTIEPTDPSVRVRKQFGKLQQHLEGVMEAMAALATDLEPMLEAEADSKRKFKELTKRVEGLVDAL